MEQKVNILEECFIPLLVLRADIGPKVRRFGPKVNEFSWLEDARLRDTRMRFFTSGQRQRPQDS